MGVNFKIATVTSRIKREVENFLRGYSSIDEVLECYPPGIKEEILRGMNTAIYRELRKAQEEGLIKCE